MQQNIEFERCIDFLVRMIDKYGEEVLRELEEEKQNKSGIRTVRLPEKYRGGSPQIRDLGIYEQAMERRTANG